MWGLVALVRPCSEPDLQEYKTMLKLAQQAHHEFTRFMLVNRRAVQSLDQAVAGVQRA